MSYCTMHGDGTFPLTTGEHDTHDSLRACVMVMKGKGDRTSVSRIVKNLMRTTATDLRLQIKI